MTDHAFKDKVVLIAGGAKNLGGLISREVAKQGANVVVHYNSDSSRTDAEETVSAVKELGGEYMEWMQKAYVIVLAIHQRRYK